MGKKLSKRTKNIINIVVLVVLIGITLTVLMLSYKELSFHTIAEFLRGSNAWYIAAAIACMLLFILFEGLSLHLITRRLGHKSKLRSSIAYSTADVYYSALTPSASGGQPASLYYMVRDGVKGGTAGFALIFNLVAYTMAVVVIGVFALIVRPQMILQSGNGFALTLVILGLVVQFVLAGLLLMCMLWSKLILKAGNGGITLLTKMKIIKKPEKWRGKLDGVIEKYRASKYIIKEHPLLIIAALLLNIAQRVAQTLIPCFVCFAADSTVNFLDLFCMQAYVVLGYNFIPLPGGVGAYEYLYDRFYGSYFLKHLGGDTQAANAFMVSAMMVSRTISYYICIIVSGLYTLVYHAVGIHKKKHAHGDGETQSSNDGPPSDGPPSADGAQSFNGDCVTDAESSPSKPPDAESGDLREQTAEDNAIQQSSLDIADGTELPTAVDTEDKNEMHE